jgi:hypothetical protein
MLNMSKLKLDKHTQHLYKFNSYAIYENRDSKKLKVQVLHLSHLFQNKQKSNRNSQ